MIPSMEGRNVGRNLQMKEHPAAADLLALAQMVNQAVGDALSNILLVELCLARQGWDMGDWASLYSDLPSRQLKVRVRDRMVIKTTDADRRTVSPAGLQEEIDRAVAGVPSGAFSRRATATGTVVQACLLMGSAVCTQARCASVCVPACTCWRSNTHAAQGMHARACGMRRC